MSAGPSFKSTRESCNIYIRKPVFNGKKKGRKQKKEKKEKKWMFPDIPDREETPAEKAVKNKMLDLFIYLFFFFFYFRVSDTKRASFPIRRATSLAGRGLRGLRGLSGLLLGVLSDPLQHLGGEVGEDPVGAGPPHGGQRLQHRGLQGEGAGAAAWVSMAYSPDTW